MNIKFMKKFLFIISILFIFFVGIALGRALKDIRFFSKKDGLSFVKNQAKIGGGISLKQGEKAPDFTLTDIDGRKLSLSDFRGEPVIVEIMATWCGTCISETDDLRKALSAYKNLFIISVDVDPTETDKEIDRFRRAYSLPEFDNRWFFARDTDQVSLKFGSPFTGTTILIDKDGKIAYFDAWSTDFEEIQKAMIKLGYGKGEGIKPLNEQTIEEKLSQYNLNIESEIPKIKDIYKNQGYKAILIKIENMFCPSCPRTIKRVLYKTVKGIKEVIISFYEGKAIVVFDPQLTNTDEIINSPIFSDEKYPEAPTIYDAKFIKDISL